jgi:hypothetical protein
VITNLITVFIVVVNKILTIISIDLITWIGFGTKSAQTKNITNGVFLAQFFNTGLLILLVNANLEETMPLLGGIFTGPFNDYIPVWYRSVGYTIVQTMLMNAFIPIFSQMATDAIKWAT